MNADAPEFAPKLVLHPTPVAISPSCRCAMTD